MKRISKQKDDGHGHAGHAQSSKYSYEEKEFKNKNLGTFDPFLDLPHEIAQIIFNSMNVIARIRMPAVCRSWGALSATLTPPPTEYPIVLLRDQCCPTFRLVNFSTPVPSVRHLSNTPLTSGDSGQHTIFHAVAGCHGRFLVLSRLAPLDNCIHDPFSGQTYPLPLTLMEDGSHTPLPLRIDRARLSCSLASIDPKTLVVAAMMHHVNNRQIYLCRPNFDYWTVILCPTSSGVADFYFHRRRLYAVDHEGLIIVSNDVYESTHISLYKLFFIRSQVFMYRTITQKTDQFLVESCGELFLVQRHNNPRKANIFFEVYKIVEKEEESGDGESEGASRVYDLGDRMLFLGKNSSTSWSDSWSSTAGNSEFFVRNCIYFFLDNIEGGSVGKFHLKDGVVEQFFPKALDKTSFNGHNYRNPVWVSS